MNHAFAVPKLSSRGPLGGPMDPSWQPLLYTIEIDISYINK